MTALQLTWRKFQDRPYGEDHFDLPSPIGPVDAITCRSNAGGWFWALFGTTDAYTDDEGNQDVITSGNTDTYRQAQAAVETALATIA